MGMNQDPFILDPIPPELRQARKNHEKAQKRRSVSAHRNAKRASGHKQISAFLPLTIDGEVEKYQKSHRIPTKGEAMAQLLQLGLTLIKERSVSG